MTYIFIVYYFGVQIIPFKLDKLQNLSKKIKDMA